MWNPGFATPETQPARLHGWHRAFCIYSEHYRGTPEKPGLILGLLPGGSCRGLAHRLPADGYEAVRRYLWTREIDNDGVYEEAIRPIHLADGRTVPVAGLSRRPQAPPVRGQAVAGEVAQAGAPGTRRHRQQHRLREEHRRPPA